jgi:hypothetical protein
MGKPVVPVVDWVGRGGDLEAVAGLLARAGEVGLEAGGKTLETWVTPPMPHRATLQALGFKESDSRFNLCIMVYSPDLDLEWARDNWVLTMAKSGR